MKTLHPRLLVQSDTWAKLRTQRSQDTLLDAFLNLMENNARKIQDAPPSTYNKVGRRLLSVSRAVLSRVLTLALTYHVTGQAEFARRAEEEMLAAANFQDWNPSHFLDTAEMAAAMGLGYDWLYDQLSPETRHVLRTALVRMAMEPGLNEGSPYRKWQTAGNNWNSVCMGGMLVGALAMAEDEPVWTQRMVELIQTNNLVGLEPYAPAGVYPEGPMYWSYGTTYQVILLAALNSALSTDLGLGSSPGFMDSAGSYLQTVSCNGAPFNFSDCRASVGLEAALFWFARQLNDPGMLYQQRALLKEYVTSADTGGEAQRFLPLCAIWWPESDFGAHIQPSLPLHWHGEGPNPLAIFRDSWTDSQGMYLAAKGGKATLSHGHMDAGSFVFDAQGLRWAHDLGLQDYHALESINVNLWSKAQDGERWRIFRLNNFAHNTLTLNDQLHLAEGDAPITHFVNGSEEGGAAIDLKDVLAQGVQRATRGFWFRTGKDALVVDEVEGLAPAATLRWALVTDAALQIDGSNAILSKEGKQLHLSLGESSSAAAWGEASADYSSNGIDAPNPGMRIVTLTATAPENGKVRISVTLVPGQATTAPHPLAGQPIAQWPFGG